MSFISTTIIAVRKDGVVVMAGDGQVTASNTIMKGNVRKVRRLMDGKIVVGFAGGTADAFTLTELFEGKLKSRNGDITKAAVETAREWRTNKALRQLEAMMLATDGRKIFLISGNGDVIEPEGDAIAIGSGGNFALASARTALEMCATHNIALSAHDIAVNALKVASDLCIYTNSKFTVEEIVDSEYKKEDKQ